MDGPGEPRITLTVTADDLGLCPSVNRSIIEAARGRLLKSASLMVNMPSAADALDRIAASAIPLTLGLHFTLTSGRCGAEPKSIPLLADAEGRFRFGFLGLARLLFSARRTEALQEIQTELAAQTVRFDRFRADYPALRFDHIDSHQHIHAFSGLFELLAAEANRRSLHLRVPSEPFGSLKRILIPPTPFHWKGLAKKTILDVCLGGRKMRHHLAVPPTIYFGVVDSGRMTGHAMLNLLDRIPRLARNTDRRAFEINLHPWRVDDPDFLPPPELSDADRAFCRSPGRQAEWNALADARPILEKMRRLGIIPSPFPLP